MQQKSTHPLSQTGATMLTLFYLSGRILLWLVMAIVSPTGFFSHVRKLVFPEFTICAVSIVYGIVAKVQVVTFWYLADQSCAAFEMENMDIYMHS